MKSPAQTAKDLKALRVKVHDSSVRHSQDLRFSNSDPVLHRRGKALGQLLSFHIWSGVHRVTGMLFGLGLLKETNQRVATC